jgi:hypothetical protein
MTDNRLGRCAAYLAKWPGASVTELMLNCDVDEAFAKSMLVDEGKKFDTGKARYDLIPPEIEEAIAKVLTFGAEKYGERNWEKGMKWGRPYAALRRHMAAWWSGETNDPETGMSHLWHAACCIAFLTAFEARKVGTDDRPTKAD